jgi:hypothetical protein
MEARLDTRQKALAVNLDARTYGTFAEIGAGQEVARWFFAAGAAAGTIAKSISAHDMKVSDGLYGITAGNGPAVILLHGLQIQVPSRLIDQT